MGYSRLPLKDPRTVAREIPGIFDGIFPQLTPGTVAFFNKGARASKKVQAIPAELVNASTLSRAMLFEIAFARGEQQIKSVADADWDECLRVATQRQRQHFDAELPTSLFEPDMAVAEQVGKNLALMLTELVAVEPEQELIFSPRVPGYQWIVSGNGDFAVGSRKLVEVKCTNRNFGSADYRQILMYWLLSYAASIEHDAPEWISGVLLNPRLNLVLEVPFDHLVEVTAAGRSKVEVLELFSSIVGDYALKVLPEFRL